MQYLHCKCTANTIALHAKPSIIISVHRGMILCMGSANGRRHYNVTSSLIDWAHTQNDPSYSISHKIYAVWSCFVLLWLYHQFPVNSYEPFTHILQGYFTGTGAIVQLPQYQWSNPEGYGFNQPLPNHSKRQQSKNHVHNSWDALYEISSIHRWSQAVVPHSHHHPSLLYSSPCWHTVINSHLHHACSTQWNVPTLHWDDEEKWDVIPFVPIITWRMSALLEDSMCRTPHLHYKWYQCHYKSTEHSWQWMTPREW